MSKKIDSNSMSTQDEINDMIQRVNDLEYVTTTLIKDNIQLAELSHAMKSLVNMYECDIIELQDARFSARLRRFFAPFFGGVR